MKVTFCSLLAAAGVATAAEQTIENPRIDYHRFVQMAQKVEPVREQRRITEAQFAAFAAQPGTVVLDARSADKYALLHIRGAINLPYTDFTAESLARVIPAKDTRVLIYCNNNFANAPTAFAEKQARVSLNISTYLALAAYGYTNIHELGPLLDVRTTKLNLGGSEVGKLK